MPSKGTSASKVLPLSLIREIQKFYDGGVLYIPSSRRDPVKMKDRNQTIIEQHQSGVRVFDLATKFNLSPGMVHRIIREAKGN